MTLHALPNFSPVTPLAKTKTALSFALFTTVQHEDVELGKSGKGVPAMVTYFAVGCRRKLVLYTWKDGEPQDPVVRLCAAVTLSIWA